MKRNKSDFKWRHFEPELILLCVRWYFFNFLTVTLKR